MLLPLRWFSHHGIRVIIKSHTLSRVVGSGFRQVAQVCYYRLLSQTSNAPIQDRSNSDMIYLSIWEIILAMLFVTIRVRHHLTGYSRGLDVAVFIVFSCTTFSSTLS